MADCATLESGLSHWVPSGSFGILFLASGIVRRSERRVNQAQTACVDGIQECLESVRDLKANNAESEYLKGLDDKIEAVEKQTVASELTHAVFNTSARMILKLGIATTVLTGGTLLVGGEISLLTLFAFLILVSRVYDPLIGALDNLMAMMMINIQCRRMDEILSYPEQKGTEKLPDQWNTLIGENGCELSGGERQRISIARAFLKDAPIILLDEATASLDVENETLIQESLSRLIENKTVFMLIWWRSRCRARNG